jgi:hypothetical protein
MTKHFHQKSVIPTPFLHPFLHHLNGQSKQAHKHTGTGTTNIRTTAAPKFFESTTMKKQRSQEVRKQ